MTTLKNIFAFGLAALIVSCGSMTDVALYEAPTTGFVDPMDKFGATVVYSGTKTDENWLSPEDNASCLDVNWEYPDHPTDPAGKSIHVKWDRNKSGCDWMGLGFGWNQWQAKDISSIIDYAALEIWIKTVKGSTGTVRIVYLLEDYAEKNAASGINALGIQHENKQIDSTWKKVILPLGAFGYPEGFDKQGVKQLKLEMQSAGEFVLGPMRLVPHRSEFKKLADGKAPFVMDNSDYQIFSDEMPYQWGIRPKFCPSYFYGNDSPAEGSQYISIRREGNDCTWDNIGLNWSTWAPIDFMPIYEETALRFKIRGTADLPTVPLKVGFSSWAGWETKYFSILPEHLEKGTLTTDWQDVTIPLSRLKLLQKGVGMHAVKALNFETTASTMLDIDDIRLIPYTKSTGNPFSRYN